MRQIGQLWSGELPLDNAFWNWAVFGGLAVNITSSAMFLFLVMADRPIGALITGYLFSVPYNIAVVVGVWRSAERYTGDARRADLARLVTLIGAIILSVT